MKHSDQPPRSTQPGHPFVGRHNDYQPGMVRVWVAGKTVIPLLHTGHI